jgi:hypothetical protein
MTRHSKGLKNIDVAYRGLNLVRIRATEATLLRDAFGLSWWRSLDSQKRGLSRCSSRGTSGRKWVEGIEPRFCLLILGNYFADFFSAKSLKRLNCLLAFLVWPR